MRLYIYTLVILSLNFTSAAQSSGGTLSSNTLVCSGNNNGLLSVSGYSGSIIRWEYAMGSSGPWTPLVFTSSTYNYINLIQTTYFRVIVQLTGYAEASSNIVSVVCDNISIGGTILTNTFQCINSAASSTLTANTGSVLLWEYSSNNWISTNTITTTNTLIATLASLSTTTSIRAQVKNGVCPSVFSNSVTIFPASNSIGGNITGTQSVCALANSSTLTLTNYTGAIQYWESATSSGGPFNLISSTNSTLSFTNLNQDTWYRAQVKNGSCVSSNSSVFFVNVDQVSIGGSISGIQTVCAQTNTGALQVIAQTGAILNWQVSSNAGSSWNNISNTTNNLVFSNLLTTSLYRASVQNGICPSVYSNQFTVTVNPLPNTTFTVTNVCVNSQVSFSNNSVGSNSYNWDFGDGGSSGILNPTHTYLTPGTYTVKLLASSSQNCIDSIKHSVIVYPKPLAGFFNSDTACFGNAVLFTNASSIASGSISQLKFNFGDGSPSSTLSSVSHQFLSDGIFSVTLSASSNFGCKDSLTKLISIYPKPICNFLSSNVCKGTTALFSNQSFISNGYLNHDWNFGNSANSTLISPTYLYPLAGTYTVALICKSNHNCTDTSFKSIRIHDNPSINFSVNNSCLGTPVIFQSTIVPSSVSYSSQLNYGDGSIGTNVMSSHIYSTSGVFMTILTITTDSGCISSASKNINIYPKPLANFICQNSCKGDSVSFLNVSSILNGNMSYVWQLGSSSVSNLHSPKYLYPAPGLYSVTLIVKSDFDCFDTIIKPLIIFDSPKANFIFNNSCDGFPISFTNTSSSLSGSISNHLWYFGDNSISSEINPTKEYLNQGTYSVSLTVNSNEGCIDTVKKTVNIFEGPIANFSANSACLNSTVTFSNTSVLKSGNFNSYWVFGDTSSSNANSPNHSYKKFGSYSAKLIVVSNTNCVDSISKFVECFPLPIIAASNDTAIEKGFGLSLKASGGLQYNWIPAFSLNDPTSANPFANPESSIQYVVEGTDKNGCKNSDTLVISVDDNFLVIPYNILTPDGNGLNDVWVVKNIQTYPQNSLVIFNQWNEKVYEKLNYNNEWDGKNNAGESLPDATYYYILSFKNNPKIYSGYITLIRNAK